MFTSRKDNTNDASSTQKEYIYTKTGCYLFTILGYCNLIVA